jgi:hypothetical protein
VGVVVVAVGVVVEVVGKEGEERKVRLLVRELEVFRLDEHLLQRLRFGPTLERMSCIFRTGQFCCLTTGTATTTL